MLVNKVVFKFVILTDSKESHPYNIESIEVNKDVSIWVKSIDIIFPVLSSYLWSKKDSKVVRGDEKWIYFRIWFYSEFIICS